MEDVKKKLIERLKKLREEEKEKREKIQESKLEGGDNIDNQDYQFNLETLMKLTKERTELQQRLEQIEKEEVIVKELEERRIKSKANKKLVYVPLVGKKFELLLQDHSKVIKLNVVPLYEEIESNGDEYSVSLESPVVKMLERLIERFLFELEKKIEKIISSESDLGVIVSSIENLREWIAITNHQKFIKKIKNISDKNKILKELEEFLSHVELDNEKIFEAIKGWQFSINVQGKEVKYKILSVN